MSDMTREEEIRNKAVSEQRELMESCDWRAGFIAGANWADSQSYSKQQLRAMGFAFDLNGNVLSPNHLAKKAAHYMIVKACEWLGDELYEVMAEPNHYYIYDVQSKSYNSLEVLINDFKKAMEEQL